MKIQVSINDNGAAVLLKTGLFLSVCSFQKAKIEADILTQRKMTMEQAIILTFCFGNTFNLTTVCEKEFLTMSYLVTMLSRV